MSTLWARVAVASLDAMETLPVDDVEPSLIGHDQLAGWGYNTQRRRRAVADGLLHRVRPGVFAIGEEWYAASPERRIVARARALTGASVEPPTLSHETAAACHGLPLYSPDPHRLHATVPTARPGAAAGVVRHRGEPTDDEIVTVAGLRCTSLVRTVADMARTAKFERAVTVADAALRRLFLSAHNVYDSESAQTFCADALGIARRSAHGFSRAERVLGFSDGRAQLPGESVSRIRLAELGFRSPRLQVAVEAPGGRQYFADFVFDDVAAIGEFDGRMKYVDGRLLVDRTADEVFEREKQREDWIRGVTGRTVVRWGWSHIADAAALGERLAAFGVRPPN